MGNAIVSMEAVQMAPLSKLFKEIDENKARKGYASDLRFFIVMNDNMAEVRYYPSIYSSESVHLSWVDRSEIPGVISELDRIVDAEVLRLKAETA